MVKDGNDCESLSGMMGQDAYVRVCVGVVAGVLISVFVFGLLGIWLLLGVG